MKQLFKNILLKYGFSDENAEKTAGIFADNSCDGVYSHGLNRFPRFVSYLKNGDVDPNAQPTTEASFGAFERWNGNLGIGCLNASMAMDRAMGLAGENGVGCVAMRFTNHWMRGGTYGLQAARAGFMSMCWSNTAPNLPSWGARTPNLGNNPLVMAFPYSRGTLLCDGAMSQFSNGALDKERMAGRELPVPGGYDKDGSLTTDPGAILESMRPLPIGYWKGSGYSLMLDFFGAALSQGNTVPDIGRRGTETGLTQVFIAFDIKRISGADFLENLADRLIKDFRSAEPAVPGKTFTYPGERMAKTREDNLKNGIPVVETIWEELKKEL